MSDLQEQLKQLRDDPKFWTFHQTPKLRRLWQLANDMVWVSAEWDPDSVATWKPADWVIQLRLRSGVKQFEKDLARFRQEGMMEPDVIRFKFCQRRQLADTLPAAIPSVETRMSRPRSRYPSDEKRKTQSNGHSVEHSAMTPQPLRTDSTAEPSDTPQTLRNDSATAPQSTPQPSRMRACPDPDSGYPDSGTDDLYKNSGSGNPEIPESGNPEKPVLRASQEPPPLSTVQRLAALGMDPAKAQARLTEFGEARCQDALDALAYLAKAPDKPAGWIVNFLVQKKPLPAALVKAREAAQQQGMTMLSSIAGGATGTPEAARQANERLRSAQWRPPPGVDPPKDVLSAARDAVRRLG